MMVMQWKKNMNGTQKLTQGKRDLTRRAILDHNHNSVSLNTLNIPRSAEISPEKCSARKQELRTAEFEFKTIDCALRNMSWLNVNCT